MSFSIVIEVIYKVKGSGSTITGKIQESNNILIQDGANFTITTSSGFIGKGFFPVYGHKKTLFKTGDYFTIAISTSNNVQFQTGDIFILTPCNY